jgi:hypothetical protein
MSSVFKGFSSEDTKNATQRSAFMPGMSVKTQNDPVLTSPARLKLAMITPLGKDLDSTNV